MDWGTAADLALIAQKEGGVMRRVVSTVVVIAALAAFAIATPAQATYPGKNGRIAYVLQRGDHWQIWTIKADGSGRRQLTHVDGSAVAPDWSPDGRRIVFEFDHASGPVSCSVEIMDRDGSNVRDLTGGQAKACDGDPSFTPNGRRIVFTAEGDETIMSMNLQGKDRRFILHSGRRFGTGDFIVKLPRVSPDGRTILFGAEQLLGNIGGFGASVHAVYSVRMNGTHLTPVVPYDLDAPAGDWAPNGKRIESGDNAGYGAPQAVPHNVLTVRPDGTGLRFVTHYTGIDVGAGAGTYSPDGRWIVFRVQRDDHYSLWKIHPDGTGKRLIARFKYNPGTRDWGPRP
jgi:Tol biopolymer transport system component